jgi:3-oxoacyl-[acyl-carrier protein] reductase
LYLQSRVGRLTRVWAAELGEKGTKVNCVNPGPVESEMLRNVPREIVEAQIRDTPVERRMRRAGEVAEGVGMAGWGSEWMD